MKPSIVLPSDALKVQGSIFPNSTPSVIFVSGVLTAVFLPFLRLSSQASPSRVKSPPAYAMQLLS